MKKENLVHGIDIKTPGGIGKLMDFHRAMFGDATMLDDSSTTEDSTDTVTDESEVVEPVVEVVEDAVVEEAPVVEVKDWEAEATKWQTFSRKNETNAKANLAKVKELETELSGLKVTAETVDKLSEENITLLKRLVALETGLPSNLSDRLRGDTEEELRADAESLKPTYQNQKTVVKPISLQGNGEPDTGAPKVKSKAEYLALRNNK
jgi:myosin heavy subunit